MKERYTLSIRSKFYSAFFALISFVCLLVVVEHSWADPDVFDAGGGRSSSANVVNVGSIGGWGGVSTTTSGVAKHGFVGQLYEHVGMVVKVAPASLNEGATSQLSVEVTLDDATILAIDSSSVSWKSLSGSLMVDTDGLVSAATVYQATPGNVRGRVGELEGSVALTILNSDPDNYRGFAGDGIDDALQVGVVVERPFVNIILTELPSGDFYFELEGADWELLYSEDLQLDSWRDVGADSFFVADGKGWRIAKGLVPDAWFLKARLK